MDDLISRQKALEFTVSHGINIGAKIYVPLGDVTEYLRDLPPAQPEPLTDDDFETIRIHLNAFKEELCNQRRWKEAEEYERIIDRFMAFASAQPQSTMCQQTGTSQSTKDLISRHAAIDAIEALVDAMFKNIEKGATFPKRQWFDGMANAQSIIEDLPSAQPDWDEMIVICDCCGHAIHVKRL